MAYSEIFKDHLANPRNAGAIADANAVVEECNPICGDRLKLFLRVQAGVIQQAGFLAYGCAPTIASGSALTELVTGKSIENALVITRRKLIETLGGLPTRKQHAAALAIEALKSALLLVPGAA